MLIVIQPVIGVIFYVIFAEKKISGKKSKSSSRSYRIVPYNENNDALLKLSQLSSKFFKLSCYLTNSEAGCVSTINDAQIFAPCNDVEEKIVSIIKKSKYYVFVEMYILTSGYFLDRILSALEEKKRETNDYKIYFLLDGVGSFSTINRKDRKRIEKLDIKIKFFNRFRVLLRPSLNYRNHRKMIIIDGKEAILGGMNIADEYINRIKRYGHWFDSVVLLSGEVVNSMVRTFLIDWEFVSGERLDESEFINKDFTLSLPIKTAQFFASMPTESDLVAENVVINLINSAKKSIYITTPYLALDKEVEMALKNASLSNVSVNIIIPGIPDKKLSYLITKDYAERLLKYGVKIYAYAPGFIHSKMILVDDAATCVSSVNLDYRSMYINFESGIIYYDRGIIDRTRDIFEDLLADSNIFVAKKRNIIVVVLVRFLKIFIGFF